MCSLLFSNIFSGIGTTLLLYSTFGKRKDKALLIQSGSLAATMLSYLFIGSYSAILSCLISITRNILVAKEKMSLVLLLGITFTLSLLGIFTNNNGVVGLLPVIASVEYTIWCSVCKTAQSLRWALFVNTVLWVTFNICVSMYLFAAMDAVTLIITIINIIKYRR